MSNQPQASDDYCFGSYSASEQPKPAPKPAPETASNVERVIATDVAFEELKRRIHSAIVQQIESDKFDKLPVEHRRDEARKVINHCVDLDSPRLNSAERRKLVDELLDDMLGLGPLEKLLRDPTISDILVNGPHQIYIERRGILEESPIQFRDNKHLMEVIYRIVSAVGRRVDEMSPIVDARLPDGSRVNAIIAPLSLRGASMSIRRFGANPLKFADLINIKAIAPEMAQLLEAAVKMRLNIVISGGTGSGKTTLLNALSSFIPNTERIITIEDAAEVRLQQRHVVQLESRPPNIEGNGEITMRALVRNSLRMRPNRIIIGECRGAEAMDMLQAMMTGHEGSMTTLHANTPRDALTRLEIMLLMAGMEIPLRALREQLAAGIDLIIQAERLPGGPRRVTSITEVLGCEGDVVSTQEIFGYRQQGIDSEGKAHGRFEATGLRPNFASRFEAERIDLPPELFRQRVLMQA